MRLWRIDLIARNFPRCNSLYIVKTETPNSGGRLQRGMGSCRRPGEFKLVSVHVRKLEPTCGQSREVNLKAIYFPYDSIRRMGVASKERKFVSGLSSPQYSTLSSTV